jgi:hypothetical protein
MKKCTYLFVTIFSAAALVRPAWGQIGGGYELSWSTIDGGGVTLSTGGAFELGGTIGQPDAQTPPIMSNGAFQLTGGFWPVANVCYCLGDLNGDSAKDGRDVQVFVDCLTAGGNCACADMDGMNGVNIADVSFFVADLLSAQPCP